MKKLLITGFEPFGEETINPSWDAVKSLPSQIGRYSVEKLLLPVVFGVKEKVIKYAEEIHPNVIICVGQAGGRKAITPELVAINLRYAKTPDNYGNMPIDEPVVLGGEPAFFSTLPVRKIAEAINRVGIPSEVSYSAGAYVCNDTFYSLLSHYRDGDVKIGFIHIPYSTLQYKEPSMDMSDIVRALTVAIESIDS